MFQLSVLETGRPRWAYTCIRTEGLTERRCWVPETVIM